MDPLTELFATPNRSRRVPNVAALLLLLVVVSSGCASTQEAATREDLRRHPFAATPSASSADIDTASAPPPMATSASDNAPTLGTLTSRALAQHPALETAFEAWRQQVLLISAQKRLPAPTMNFGLFLLAVETRVGPQLGRVGLQQAFPWPGRLLASADAATAKAIALQRAFDAKALVVTQRVAEAYWTLWEVRRRKAIHGQHLVLLQGIASSVRARLVTGAATAADVQQIDLNASRLEEMILGMNEEETMALARLREEVGLEATAMVSTEIEPPAPAMPTASLEDLVIAAQTHPGLKMYDALVDEKNAMASASDAELFPSFFVGVDWIVTGAAVSTTVPESGKDAVMVNAGITIPVWEWLLNDNGAAARAGAKMVSASRDAAQLALTAQIQQTFSALRDAKRREATYSSTLLPQAESMTSAVLGAFATGKSPVAQVLLAQRDVLELRIAKQTAVADAAKAWARLEQLVGHPLQRAPESAPPRGQTPASHGEDTRVNRPVEETP